MRTSFHQYASAGICLSMTVANNQQPAADSIEFPYLMLICYHAGTWSVGKSETIVVHTRAQVFVGVCWQPYAAEHRLTFYCCCRSGHPPTNQSVIRPHCGWSAWTLDWQRKPMQSTRHSNALSLWLVATRGSICLVCRTVIQQQCSIVVWALRLIIQMVQ
jgi:hypothetical protein